MVGLRAPRHTAITRGKEIQTLELQFVNHCFLSGIFAGGMAQAVVFCIFFCLAPFSATVSCSDCFTGQSPRKRGTRGPKVQGPCRCLLEWRKSTKRGWAGQGFGQDLAPVGMIGFFNVVRIWGGFAERGGCKGGHGCIGCNALLEDGEWLSRFGSCEVADKGCGLLAPPAPNLACKHHQSAALVVEEFWVGSFCPFAGILQSGSCEPSCSASGLAFSSEW